jgi:hypothetical protein
MSTGEALRQYYGVVALRTHGCASDEYDCGVAAFSFGRMLLSSQVPATRPHESHACGHLSPDASPLGQSALPWRSRRFRKATLADRIWRPLRQQALHSAQTPCSWRPLPIIAFSVPFCRSSTYFCLSMTPVNDSNKQTEYQLTYDHRIMLSRPRYSFP